MGLRRLLLSWILLLQGAGAASAVSVVGGALGGSVHFSVSLPSEANGAVQWTSKGVLVALLSPGSAPQYYGQCVRRCNVYSNGSLTLDNIAYTDEGEYTVTAFNSDSAPVTSETFQLRVYATLSKPDLRILSSSLVNGTNVTLYCDAGSPNVTTYIFYRGEKTVNCSERHVTCRGAYLDFTPITESDSGSYTCSIQNPVSSSTSAPQSLTVSVVKTGLQNRGKLVPQMRFSYCVLRCSAGGTSINYSWSLQGAPISGGGRFHLRENNATLTISPVFSADDGSFICTATNILNSRDVKMDLASPVSAVSLTSNTSGALWAGQDSVSLYCTAQGSDITFSWRLNGLPVSSNPPYNITGGESPPTSTLTISPISRSHSGPFTCTATNWLNNETSNEINLEINWTPNGNIQCTANAIDHTNVQLGCSWSGGKPAANVNMIFNNTQDTRPNEVYRNVTSGSNIQGSNLTCNGDQLGTTQSSCSVTFEPLNSTGLPNNTLSNVTEGGRVSLIVSLISGARARADSSTSQTLPAKFSWYRHPSLETIVTGGPFIVISSDYTSNLTINPVSMAQNGTYECRAENVMGSATFIFNVVVSPKVGSSTGLNGGEIVGIVIGVLAGVALIGVIAFFAVKKKDTKEVIYENADPPAVHIYDTKLPAAGVVTAMPMREESNYQQLTHPDKSVYHTVMPGPGR
ncbi:V-set and immunoglobulin domain-containing protein 10-like [Leptodactylus fuscus]|uniref:V-set and immunoglobulin domain-containing protein 10-like n=1 Tax=Leptodactylus fuscus TaxID=238119 RepID=UPI003F4E556D